MSDITSLTGFNRLTNLIEYCINVRKTGPAGKESNNSATVERTITNNAHGISAEIFDWGGVLPSPHQLVGFLLFMRYWWKSNKVCGFVNGWRAAPYILFRLSLPTTFLVVSCNYKRHGWANMPTLHLDDNTIAGRHCQRFTIANNKKPTIRWD